MTQTRPPESPVALPLTIDHAAHFVPDISGASAALEKIGFTLTPFSEQSTRPDRGGPPVTAGTGNRCVILQQGYLEFLAPTHDTANANQLRAAISRYTGIHLIAFGSTDAFADHARLMQEGFEPLEPIALQREVDTETASGTVRFTVVRVPPGVMEGRIQYCQHHTPDLVWQPRWMTHRNAITGLLGIILCVADPEAAARRHAKFTGLSVTQSGNAWRLETSRGVLLFVTPQVARERLGIAAPTLPWIAGTLLETSDFATTEHELRDSGTRIHTLTQHCALVELPAALGGILIFQRQEHNEIHALFGK